MMQLLSPPVLLHPINARFGVVEANHEYFCNLIWITTRQHVNAGIPKLVFPIPEPLNPNRK